MALAACGGSGTGSSSTAVDVSSLTSIPDMDSFVGSTSSSSLVKAVVTGTAPLLTSIDETDIDTLFYNGALAAINDGTFTNEERDNLWKGMGACYVAQNTGYSFQNIMSGGASLCYMKNAPSAEGAMEVVSGSATASNLFAQGTSTKVVKVTPSQEGDMGNIFIKILGTGTTDGSAGYAVDLYFCDNPGQAAPTGMERIRVNTTAGTIDQYTKDGNDEGTFTMHLQGNITTDGSGNIIYDADSERSANVYFGADAGFSFKGYVALNGDRLTSKGVMNGSFGASEFTDKNYVVSEFSGSSLDTLRFLAAGFSGQSTQGDHDHSYSGAMEFQTNRYVGVSTGELYDLATAFSFSSDSFFSTIAADNTLDSSMSAFSCTATSPDVAVTLNMGATSMQSVRAECENRFADMNFCNSNDVQEAMGRVFSVQ